MLIEIHGAGFQNKGAELMLRTTVHELETRLQDFRPAIDPTYGDYEARCELKLQQIFPARYHVGTYGFSKRLKIQKFLASRWFDKIFTRFAGVPLSRYGCFTLNSIEALIDISGFAYTDQWGAKPTVDFSELTAFYRAKNKPVILLPQALGPFQNRETQIAFNKVVNHSTLIFARDEKSYEHATNVVDRPEKIYKAPDITLFYSSMSCNEKEAASDQERYICIIPNVRMLDQGKNQWGDKYEIYLTKAIQEALSHSIKVYLVVHDSSGQDLEIAHRLYSRFSKYNVFLMQESNPLKLKEFIANSLLVIGSRYHSLVAAFSKQVPAIAMGWSHKYEMLFSDFDFEDFLISPDTSLETFLDGIRALIELETNSLYREKIGNKLGEMQLKNQKMWELVVATLDGNRTTHIA